MQLNPNYKCVDFYINNEEIRTSLGKDLVDVDLDKLLHDYYALHDNFRFALIDIDYLSDKKSEMQSILNHIPGILITDKKSKPSYSYNNVFIYIIFKEDIILNGVKEILKAINKCVDNSQHFLTRQKEKILHIQKSDDTFKLVKSGDVYLFTKIDSNTYMYYKNLSGEIKQELVHKNLFSLEKKLGKHGFFRTHKNYLVNSNKLNNHQPIKSPEIKLNDNVVAKLSRKKEEDFIHFLENI